jgi:hypothetical protein
MLHAHSAGWSIKVERVNENGRAFSTLGYEPYYDNSYQIANIFEEPIHVYPNESFHLTCTYYTVGRTSYTNGGLSTMDEMCLAYYVYYPRSNFSKCVYGEVDFATGDQVWPYT